MGFTCYASLSAMFVANFVIRLHYGFWGALLICGWFQRGMVVEPGVGKMKWISVLNGVVAGDRD